jgi:hypothetical protein
VRRHTRKHHPSCKHKNRRTQDQLSLSSANATADRRGTPSIANFPFNSRLARCGKPGDGAGTRTRLFRFTHAGKFPPTRLCCCCDFAARANVAGTMDAPGQVPDTINCHQCQAPIDLAGHQAFTYVECNRCGELSVVPVKFAGFLLLSAQGLGGMGTVYKALDLSLHRYLAVKILRKKLAGEPHYVENFAHEARAAAAVNHPNVAQIYSFGEQGGAHYLAMELLERGSLDDRITRVGKLPEREVLEIGAQIAAGLRAALRCGLLHRDIKPGNILFNDAGTPKLVDFGLARGQPEADQAGGMVWGTPYYIAPEKLRSQSEDFRSDMYSLGATLVHALTGRPPADVLPPETPPVVSRMMAKDPSERYDSYDVLIFELHDAERRLRPGAATLPAPNRFPTGLILGAVTGLVACGIALWLMSTNRERPEPVASPAEVVVVTNVVTVAAPSATPKPEPADQKVEAETQQLKTLDAAIAADASRYDFEAALSKLEAQSFATDAARQQLNQRQALARLWVEFKNQLAADFTRQPFDAAGLTTRDGLKLEGKMMRATPTQIILANPSGVAAVNWKDLAPATLIQLAEFYAVGDKAAAGHRYLMLAAFAKEFASDRLPSYLARAAPGPSPDRDAVFGKAN